MLNIKDKLSRSAFFLFFILFFFHRFADVEAGSVTRREFLHNKYWLKVW